MIIMLFLSSSAFAQNKDAIIGEWFTEDERSIVEIYRCDSFYCGKIVWLKEPKDEEGKDKVDTKNPDISKRDVKLLGLNILWGFKYRGNNEWEGGKIYDPKNGKTYSCKIKLESNKLKVRGFIGVSLLGRTTTWTKKV
jgi:uncharacterized protein (DUF2147 family)